MNKNILMGTAMLSIVLASSMPFASAASAPYFAEIGGTDVVDLPGTNPSLQQAHGDAEILSVVPLLNGDIRVTVFCKLTSSEDCDGDVVTM